MKSSDLIFAALMIGGGYYVYKLYQQSRYSAQIQEKTDIMRGAIVAGKPLSPIQLTNLFRSAGTPPITQVDTIPAQIPADLQHISEIDAEVTP